MPEPIHDIADALTTEPNTLVGEVPVLNLDDYRQDLATFNLTVEQEDALLKTLWWIMMQFVEWGWGVHNIHRVLPELFEKASRDSGKSLQQEDTVSPKAIPRQPNNEEEQ
tara:strand:+ start:595 stop:924 length:330 start_codon:yes stop_codon:yes gene_type:complete